MYCPERIMNRAESAVFVVRGVHGADFTPPDPAEKIFDDVALTEWYAKWAKQLWIDGYTAGCGTDPLTYCPLQEHTIAEGSVFYLRMKNGADYAPPDPTGMFADVPLEPGMPDGLRRLTERESCCPVKLNLSCRLAPWMDSIVLQVHI
ncbi:MAG: hypothetical protein A2Z14_04990 [Chloroflexi bacterium RBG_16_48_8]|nr:MAG: hypothetical protein A2Z14_04990 [Chloroflexi bacterium RBG_16_48_8]